MHMNIIKEKVNSHSLMRGIHFMKNEDWPTLNRDIKVWQNDSARHEYLRAHPDATCDVAFTEQSKLVWVTTRKWSWRYSYCLSIS